MTVTVYPGRTVGTAEAPPSKSLGHRALITAGLAEGTSVIRKIADSEDMLATMDCLRALGAVSEKQGDTVTVTGGGVQTEEALFPCRESGSTLRLLMPAALVRRGEAVFTGTPRLMTRGIGVYEELFKQKQITAEKSERGITVRGTLTPGDYTVRGDVSSQFISGLLLALPLLDGDSRLTVTEPVESRPYIDLTLGAMADAGVNVKTEENVFIIPGSQKYQPIASAVEGDWSNGAFLLALNALGGNVTVTGLNEDSRQGDRVAKPMLEALAAGDAQLDLADCPDLAPVLFAVAAAKHGGTFTGTRRLKIKESDRAEAMKEELKKLGIRVDVEENTVRVFPGSLHAPTEPLSGHNDHRIVMALALLLTLVGGSITGAEAVKKSYPEFFAVLQKLNIEVDYGTEN